jgi:hypothetical protein
MTTVTDTDLQQVKDLIITGNTAVQKQITDLGSRMDERFSKLEQRVEVGFAEIKGDIKELRAELKGLDAKFEEKTKNLDQRITSKEFTIRGVTVTILGGILLAFGKLLFFGKI